VHAESIIQTIYISVVTPADYQIPLQLYDLPTSKALHATLYTLHPSVQPVKFSVATQAVLSAFMLSNNNGTLVDIHVDGRLIWCKSVNLIGRSLVT